MGDMSVADRRGPEKPGLQHTQRKNTVAMPMTGKAQLLNVLRANIAVANAPEKMRHRPGRRRG